MLLLGLARAPQTSVFQIGICIQDKKNEATPILRARLHCDVANHVDYSGGHVRRRTSWVMCRASFYTSPALSGPVFRVYSHNCF